MRMTRPILFWALAAAPLLAESAIPEAMIHRLKEATVFIEVQHGAVRGTGSGFLIKRRIKTGWIVTNAHVIESSQTQSSTVSVVFGSGTKRERVTPAKVVASDSVLDLAVLQIELPELPIPITLQSKAKLIETLPLYILGYPFGKALSTNRGNPAVTIGKGTVSSIRRDEFGNLQLVQIDGDINPGNSGGPIVDGRGRLLGVSVATVLGTQIGLAIPSATVNNMLMGRVHKWAVESEKHWKGGIELGMEVELIDPMQSIKRVSVILVPKDRLSNKPVARSDGRFGMLKRGKTYSLQIKGQKASGVIKLRNTKAHRVTYLQQIRYVRKDTKTFYTEPAELILDFSLDASDEGAPGEDHPIVADMEGSPESVPEAVDSETPMPDLIEDVAVAGAGRYLVCKLKSVPGLVIYDSFQGKIAKILRLPSDDFVFAAGGSIAIIYFKENNILQTWDLKSFEKLKTKPNPISGVIMNMLMGHSRSDLAVVHASAGTEQLSRTGNYFLTTKNLQLRGSNGKPYQFHGKHNSFRDRARFRTDGGLTYLTEWGTTMTPSGVTIMTLRGTDYTIKSEHTSAGYLAMGDDRRIYAANGTIYSSNLVTLGKLEKQALFPGIGGSFFLGLNNNGVLTIYEAGKTTPISSYGPFPGWDSNKENVNKLKFSRDELPFDHRVTFVPAFGRIMFIPPENDRIILKKFNIQAILDESGVDYLFVRSAPSTHVTVGRVWKYQVQVLSKAGEVKYELELAPKSMRVSDDGLISWTPSFSTSAQGEKIVLLISDSSGEQTYHNFTLIPNRSK